MQEAAEQGNRTPMSGLEGEHTTIVLVPQDVNLNVSLSLVLVNSTLVKKCVVCLVFQAHFG